LIDTFIYLQRLSVRRNLSAILPLREPALLIPAAGAVVLINLAILPLFMLLLGSFQAERIVFLYRKTFGLR
jgi:hypothetical protein